MWYNMFLISQIWFLIGINIISCEMEPVKDFSLKIYVNSLYIMNFLWEAAS